MLAIAAQACHISLGKKSAALLANSVGKAANVFNNYLGICRQTTRFQSSYQVDTCFQHVVPFLHPPKSKIKPNQNGGLRAFSSAVMKESTRIYGYQTLRAQM